MPYAFMRKAPFDADTHRSVREHIGPETPVGLVLHLVFRRDGDLEFLDVWETEEDWARFQSERLGPAVQATLRERGASQGSAPTPVPAAQIEVIDAMVGSAGAVAAISLV
jgi:hypothetical protein